MSRPVGPKRQAAIEQTAALRAKGVPDAEIRATLIASGLTKQQAFEVCPRTEAEKLGLPAPMIVQPVDDDMRLANINGAINFLDTVAKRLTPTIIDRFKELGEVRNDALTWARKLKGAL